MKKKITILLSYIIFFFNTNLFANEHNQILKIGLLAPLSGEYKELGNSILYSLQLALDEINDEKVFIVPKDSGFNDDKKLIESIEDLKSQDIKIVIGPISKNNFKELKKYNEMVFISPSNIDPKFTNNIISIGISLESQLIALKKFIKKQKKRKTVIMFPNNDYTPLIEENLKKMDFENVKIFKYSSNPEVLTGEIEILTNYSQRKKNLES